jgi:hypothetical protein
MSLKQAIESVSSILPENFVMPIDSNSLAHEYTTTNFSIWKVNDFDKLKHIIEGRLKMSHGQKINDWLTRQYEFIKHIKIKEDLWQAYLIEGNIRVEFLINGNSQQFISSRIGRK